MQDWHGYTYSHVLDTYVRASLSASKLIMADDQVWMLSLEEAMQMLRQRVPNLNGQKLDDQRSPLVVRSPVPGSLEKFESFAAWIWRLSIRVGKCKMICCGMPKPQIRHHSSAMHHFTVFTPGSGKGAVRMLDSLICFAISYKTSNTLSFKVSEQLPRSKRTGSFWFTVVLHNESCKSG